MSVSSTVEPFCQLLERMPPFLGQFLRFSYNVHCLSADIKDFDQSRRETHPDTLKNCQWKFEHKRGKKC